RSEHALASQVEVAAVLEHGARRNLADHGAAQAEPIGQRIEGGGEHVLVGGLRVCAVLPRKRNPDAAEHRDRSDTWVRFKLLLIALPAPARGSWIASMRRRDTLVTQV